MSVAKTVEITASSPKSFEEAIRHGVKKMSQTVDNIEGVWVKGQKCIVRDGEIAEYRADLKVTFVVK